MRAFVRLTKAELGAQLAPVFIPQVHAPGEEAECDFGEVSVYLAGELTRLVIDELGFAPLDDTGSQLLFRFVAAAYERRSLGIASHWPFEEWGRFLPEHSTAVALLDRPLHHAITVVTSGDSFRMKEARTRGGGPPPTP